MEQKQYDFNEFVNKLVFLFKILSIVCFVFGIYFCSFIVCGDGDEALFLKDLNFIKSFGWISAIEHKISIPYLVLAYPFSFIFEDYIALRLVNIMLFIVLIFYFKKSKIVKNDLFYYFLIYFSATGWYFLGTNDVLFAVTLVVFFSESYSILNNYKRQSNTLFWCSLIVAIFTREMFVIYLPAIIISFFFIYKKNHFIYRKIAIPIVLFLIMIFANLPSIIKNKSLSYDNKLPPKGIHSTWSQRQYLAQLLVNEGKIKNNTHPTWNETDDYLKINGEQSLPISTLSGIFFNIKLTIKEFFKDFLIVMFFSIRTTGLIIVLTFFYLIISIFDRKISYNLYVPSILLVTTALLSFIIISYVEARWLLSVYIMSILFYANNIKKITLFDKTFITNISLSILVMIFGIYRMYIILM